MHLTGISEANPNVKIQMTKPGVNERIINYELQIMNDEL